MKKQYVEGRDWSAYRKANSNFPLVRKNELNYMFNLVNPKNGEQIIEMGTGNGVLTIPMAKVIDDGRIITYDATDENISSIIQKNKTLNLPISAKIQNLDYSIEEEDGSIDKICSIAAFHHYDNNLQKTGFNGRLRAMYEFARVLKPGGQLTIGDVCNNTVSSRYFDSIDTPVLCPGGHPHDFLEEESIKFLCNISGFKVKTFEIKQVSWTFESIDEAGSFINMIHGSLCSKEESLEHAKKYLKFWQEDGLWNLEWCLFYLVAIKL